jgi:hypothetical protein
MDRMRIRAAQVGDAEAVADLANRDFRPERFFTGEDRTNPDKVRALLESESSCCSRTRIRSSAASTLRCRVNEDTSACWRSSPAASDPASGRA